MPIFIGFVESGIPLGVTFTFLVTSPIVNEIAIGFLIMTFGLKIAVIYTIAGMCIGMFSGYLIDKLHLEHLVESYIYEMQSGETIVPDMTWQDRIEFAVQKCQGHYRSSMEVCFDWYRHRCFGAWLCPSGYSIHLCWP